MARRTTSNASRLGWESVYLAKGLPIYTAGAISFSLANETTVKVDVDEATPIITSDGGVHFDG